MATTKSLQQERIDSLLAELGTDPAKYTATKINVIKIGISQLPDAERRATDPSIQNGYDDKFRKVYVAYRDHLNGKLMECRKAGASEYAKPTGEKFTNPDGTTVDITMADKYCQYAAEESELLCGFGDAQYYGSVKNEIKFRDGSTTQTAGLEEYQKNEQDAYASRVGATEASIFTQYGSKGLMAQSAYICDIFRTLLFEKLGKKEGQKELERIAKVLNKEYGDPSKHFTKEEKAALGKGNFFMHGGKPLVYEMLADIYNEVGKEAGVNTEEYKDAVKGIDGAVKNANGGEQSKELTDALTALGGIGVAKDCANANASFLTEEQEIEQGVLKNIADAKSDKMRAVERDTEKAMRNIPQAEAKKLLEAKENVTTASCQAAAANLEKDGNDIVAGAPRTTGRAPDRASGPFYKRCQAVVAALFSSIPSEGMSMKYRDTWLSMQKGKGVTPVTQGTGQTLNQTAATSQSGASQDYADITIPGDEQSVDGGVNDSPVVDKKKAADAQYNSLEVAKAELDKLAEEYNKALQECDGDKLAKLAEPLRVANEKVRRREEVAAYNEQLREAEQRSQRNIDEIRKNLDDDGTTIILG